MPVFSYKAIAGDHQRVNGTLVADTPRRVRDQLRARGLRVREVSCRRARGAEGRRKWRGKFLGRRHATQVVSFVRELSTLLGVGVPLLEAIETLGRQHRGKFHTVLLQLQDRIAAGSSLAEAMRQQPEVFDELAISIAEVGQSAGTLDVVLERLADFLEKKSAVRGKIGTALIYPSLVLLVTLGVTALLMTFVVPKLLDTLLQAGQPIPLVTRIVKHCSDLLVNWWWVLLLAAGGLATGASLALGSPGGRRTWHRLQLRIPLLGSAIRKQAIARIAVILSTLMRSGVVFVRALQIAERATTNTHIRDALLRCETAVNSGAEIGAALAATDVFPPMAVQVFAVGQQSGKLEEMLERLAADYERQVATLTQRLSAVLEPALVLFMVIVVGFVAFATMLPMLQAANAF